MTESLLRGLLYLYVCVIFTLSFHECDNEEEAVKEKEQEQSLHLLSAWQRSINWLIGKLPYVYESH